MIKSKFLFAIALAAAFLPAYLWAAEITEEEIVPEDTQKIYIDEEDELGFFARGKINNIVGVSFGFDNNVNLDSEKDGDAFGQLYYKTSFTSAVTRDKKVKGTLEYEMMTLVYDENFTLDFIKNGIHAGVAKEINKDWSAGAGYRLNAYSYFHAQEDNFYENAAYWNVKQNLPLKMFHQLGYEFSYRNYMHRNTRVNAAAETDKKRADQRNTVNYELGKYFPNDLVKLGFEYFNNNSNDAFINYYDYDSYKAHASLTHIFNDKFFGFLGFSRQLRQYRSRSITLDPLNTEWDKTYALTSAFYYNYNKSLTFGLSYTYRHNLSNEPIEQYCGSMVALSTYYRF